MKAETVEIDGHGAHRYELPHGAELVHIPGYLSAAEAAALGAACEKLPWAHQKIRGMPTRRANAWLADDPRAVYEYSRQVWSPAPLPAALRELGAKLALVVGEELNCALATFYPDGRAAVDYHPDDEPIFGKNPTVASVSLGATRMFNVVHRSRRNARKTIPDLTVELRDGALVIMRGTFQHEYLHALHPAAASVGPRYNLSYRRHRSVRS